MPIILDRALMTRERLRFVPALGAYAYVRQDRIGHWMNFMRENSDG